MSLATTARLPQPPIRTASPERGATREMTIEEILLRGTGRQQGGAQIRHGVPRPARRRQRLHFPPPPRRQILRWAKAHPWLAGLALYAAWMIGWAALLWSNSGYD